MKKSEKPKKKRGRRHTPRGLLHGHQVAVRLTTEEVRVLDDWIAEQKARFGVEFSRAAAVRSKLNLLK